MTDEGALGNPMDAAEAIAALGNMAMLVRVFYDGLIEQRFSPGDALRLTSAYIHGVAGGKLE